MLISKLMPRMGRNPLLNIFTPGSDCVLWMPGQDDPQSATIRDRSGSRNNGTITGATWSRLGSGLWTLDFASGNFVDCGNGSSLNFTTSDFSLEAWINLTSAATNPTIFCRGLHLTDGYFAYINTNRGINFLTEQSGDAQNTVAANATITLATWTHLLITRDGATVKMYKNGVEVTYATVGVHTNPTTSTRNFRIGILDDEASQPFVGKIALPRVYNTALTAANAGQHYQRERFLFGV